MGTITVWFLVAMNINTGETLRTEATHSVEECVTRRDRMQRELYPTFPELRIECTPKFYPIR